MSTPVTVLYEKNQVSCSVDVSQPISDIIKSLCIEQFNIQNSPTLLALRLQDTDELITDEITENEKLKLVSSPLIEAADICEKLGSTDDKTLKLTTFSLQKYIKEVEFADEFLKKGGLKSLIEIINNSSGNTLAYALTSMQNLMEHDHGWDDLVTADKNSTTSPIRSYGFDVLHEAILLQPNFLPTLVQRFASADYVLRSNSLCLINALMRHVTDQYWESFMDMLDKLNVRKAVATEAPKWEIQRVGYLGLDNMHSFMKKNPEEYQKAFFRLWNDMEATVDDFPKVSALVRSQLKFALRDEATKQLYEFENDMLKVEYKIIRDRQLKELELGDDLLRQLYTESYEFVKQQRIKCLLFGDWFPMITQANLPTNQQNLMTDVMTGLTPQLSTTTGSPTRKSIGSSQDLMFSLMSGPDTVLADFMASDYVQFSEWTDGLNMLFDKNIGSRDTAEFIQILTEIGVKVKLLDLSGERVEIPQSVEVPRELPVVENGFYYDDPFS
ncbi:1084_t:CDS:2 [Racocetra fulgida]|uniref:1084_t:CDS:1 n=1 Tax=Racocetra fulgida TaxID=60492 RepID=A0A9N9ABG7_9GLOM|nr:1084_t:CDS:2 [Racocetra fulgida]